MSIINIVTDVTGLSSTNPSIIYIQTNDTVATVTASGYLNGLSSSGFNISDFQMAVVTTQTTPSSNSHQTDMYTISVAAGVITLTAAGGGGGVTFPITVPEGGTDLITVTPYSLIAGGTTSTGPLQQVASLGTTGQLLSSNGPGALPTWITSGSAVTPSALTEVSDTNVTLTLGGTPATALLQASSITAGWTGTLAVPRGGLGLGTLTPYAVVTGGTTSTGAVQQVASLGTTGQFLQSNGAGALPTWATATGTGTVNSGTINDLAWYASTGTAVSALTTANSSGLLTNGSGVPAWVAYTGTGAPVLDHSPTINAPTLTGLATVSELVFSPSTSGISGVTDGSNAGTGFVGEFQIVQIAVAAAFAITDGTQANLTQIALGAGDWEVTANFGSRSTTSLTGILAALTLTSATIPDNAFATTITLTGATQATLPVPSLRVSVTTNTQVYLAYEVTGTGTFIGFGQIQARRVR